MILYDDFWYRAGSWDRARRVVAKVEWHRGELFPRVGFIVTNMTAGPEGVVRFYRFVANRVRLSLFVLAYNLGNFLRRLCLPKAVKHWSLRSVQVKLIKMGGRLVRHSRWLIFQLAEVSVPRRLFQECWIVSAGYRLRQAEGGYNHDLAKRGRALQGVALSSMRFHPTGRGHDDDEDGQEAWFTARTASLIG